MYNTISNVCIVRIVGKAAGSRAGGRQQGRQQAAGQTKTQHMNARILLQI